MSWTEPVFILYAVLYILAFVLAFARRKTFPFGEIIAVILIVGLGFTSVVYFITPQAKSLPLEYRIQPGEVIFILAYLVFVAWMLALGIWKRLLPSGWKENFPKNNLGVLANKLALFVIIPALSLIFIWRIGLPALGFSIVELPRQILVTVLLILLLGGFNLVAGKAAAPIRSKEFNGQQLLMGFLVTFIWNIFEVGLVEEFFFRAFLQVRLTNFFGSPLSGICAASLLFGLAHAPGIYLRGAGKDDPLGTKPTLIDTVLYSILVLSATGWFMGLLFWRTQSLLAPILVHAGLDTVAHMSEFIKNIDWLKKFGK
jgi:uncharacterized protein